MAALIPFMLRVPEPCRIDTPMMSESVRKPTSPTRQAIEDELDGLLRLDGEEAGELVLIRHAEPARSQGNDPMLSCNGLDQAERLADRMSAIGFDAIFSAPERRAQQTARILAGLSGLSVHAIENLADIEFNPEAAEANEPAGYASCFAQAPAWDSLAGFERSHQFRRRAVQTVERLITAHLGRRVAVIAHASVINAYLATILGLPADLFFTPEHTSLSTVRWLGSQRALRCLNDLSHLSPALDVSTRAQLFTARSLPLTSR